LLLSIKEDPNFIYLEFSSEEDIAEDESEEEVEDKDSLDPLTAAATAPK